jgi:7-keto-8-aminopelargonate synthetase-like enzyme
MARVQKYRFSRESGIEMAYRAIGDAEASGTMIRTAGLYQGRMVEIDDKMLYNFGSCSYMALEMRRDLRQAAAAAAYEYGTQFSISRAYLECALYQELETNLEIMTGRAVVVAASTTLAHLAALPILIHDEDAVIIDQFAHASLHMATELLRDVPVHLVRHSRMEQIERLIVDLTPRHRCIWLLIDGLYSMFGDLAPFSELEWMLERYPQLHIYVDDAHTISWMGTHGRGAALEFLGGHERVVVAMSLNKAFSCAGGALALPSADLKTRIRRCGGPMLFSGPIQPPMLGAAVASSRLHLTAEHARLQDEVMRRIAYARAAAQEARLPLATNDQTPIFFVSCDSVGECIRAARQFGQLGFFVCPSAFPAVPVNRPGVRFTVGLHNELEDIDALIAVARQVIPETPSAARAESILLA